MYHPDVDECQLGSFSCHAQGQCVNVLGNYTAVDVYQAMLVTGKLTATVSF